MKVESGAEQIKHHYLKAKRELLKRRIYFLLKEIGIEPIKTIRFAKEVPGFICDSINFFRSSRRFQHVAINRFIFKLSPSLHDRTQSAGSTSSLYFLQDLSCSTYCNLLNSHSHIDIGSRVDGFVAQIGTRRKLDVLDIRPALIPFKNISFVQGDICNPPGELIGQYDLVTSLHAIEHIGLGRYGDKIDPESWLTALRNCRSLASRDGKVLISLPIVEGDDSYVEFNSQRVIGAKQIISFLRLVFAEDTICWWCNSGSSRTIETGANELDLRNSLDEFEGFGFAAICWQIKK